MHLDLVMREKSTKLFREILKYFEISYRGGSIFTIVTPFERKG